jgi:hypothetical protein
MTSIQYREVTSKRSVAGAEFTRGVMDFEFSAGAPTSWIPSKSYFEIDMTVKGDAGTAQPTVEEQIAFANNVCSTLWSSCNFQAGGQDVSSITQYPAQAAQVKQRITKSGAWLNNIGSEAMLLEPNFQKRVNYTSLGAPPELANGASYVNLGAPTFYGTATVAITAGVVTGVNTDFLSKKVGLGDILVIAGQRVTVTGVTTETAMTVLPAITIGAQNTDVNAYVIRQDFNTGAQKNRVFGMWQPPIGIMDYSKPIGGGQYRFQLTPNSDFKTAAIECARDGAAPGTNYDFVINGIKLYVATVKVPADNKEDILHLFEMQVQQKTITGGNDVLHFTVPASTEMLSVFVQDAAAGFDTRVPPTAFKMIGGSQNNLRSLQLTYDNTSRPSTRWQSNYNDTPVAGETFNTLQHRYIETMHETDLVTSAGGGESFAEWMENGPLISYAFPKDQNSMSTEVQLQVDYTSLGANARIFLVASFRKATRVTTSNGQVVAVESLLR